MNSYLKNTLGITAQIQQWIPNKKLPVHLTEHCKFYLLTICGIESIVMQMDVADFQMQEFQKHKIELKQYSDHQIVLCFDKITSYQRKVLIENNQPFIVPENQLYLPFLGIALQEHFKSSIETKEQMTAMAQFVLLSFLYDRNEEYRSKMDIADTLQINLMNVSRSVQELEQFGLLETKKKGRSSMVCSCFSRAELYERAVPSMRNPVQKVIYVKSNQDILELPLAGEEALWKKGCGSKPQLKVRAIEKKEFNETMKDEKGLDPNWENDTELIKLEVWRYSPTMFSEGDMVDIISLALSMEEEIDDAIKTQIKQLLS